MMKALEILGYAVICGASLALMFGAIFSFAITIRDILCGKYN